MLSHVHLYIFGLHYGLSTLDRFALKLQERESLDSDEKEESVQPVELYEQLHGYFSLKMGEIKLRSDRVRRLIHIRLSLE